MNYYQGYNPSGYYLNPYGNQYSNPNNGLPQYPLQPQAQQQLQGLNGKIVDSEDVVKATEVPIGGYGIFPKADLSEIYIKSWNNNGTTSIITFAPQPKKEFTENQIQQTNTIDSARINEIVEHINRVEAKIDAMLNVAAAPVKNHTPGPSASQSKEVKF